MNLEKINTVLRGVFIVSAAIIVACGLAIRAGAQSSTTGAIIGTVTDPSGASIPGAAVSVVDTDTGIPHNVTTNDDGFYSATELQPGNYTVTVNKAGFAIFTHSGIVVHVGSRLTVDAPLPLVSTQATVTVTGETPLIETQKTASAQNVSENLVQGLPTNGRRWEDFVLLTPAVTTDGTSGLSSFRGISGLYNGNTVDGANNTQAFFSEARGRAIIVSYVYSADSIQEFQVNNSNYSAEYGQAAGGVVNAVTKSGTNDVHGDVFYNLRYPSLNALDPAAVAGFDTNHLTPTQTVHQQQQFGGSVGAPIKRDKLFFFGTYDGFRKVNPVLYFTTFGTPISSLNCAPGVTTTQCNAAKSFITTDLQGAFPRDLKQNIAFGKLDYQLSPANHLSAVLNIQDWDEPDGYNTAATVSNAGVTVNGFGATHERFLIANWTSTFGGNKVNDVRFQWGQDYEYDTANGPGPFVSISGLTTYGETSALPRPAFPDEHRYQMSDDFTIQKGNHSIKLGVDVNLIHELLINLFQGDGSYSYSSSDPALPSTSANNVVADCNGSLPSSALTVEQEFCGWTADTFGVNLGDTITGRHYASFTQVEDPITHTGEDDFYDNDLGAYVEDTWKVRPNLTFNLGLRYDIQHVPEPLRPNNIVNNPGATPLEILDTSTLNIDKGDIAPRIGIAWQFAKNTVLRVGYGIFFAKTSNSTYYALRVENGIYQQTFQNCSEVQTASCAPIFPDVFFTPPGPALAPAFSGALTPVAVCATTAAPGVSPSCSTLGSPTLGAQTQAIHGMDPNFVNPRADEGEITLEHQLPGNIAVSVTYLVTRGLHLPASYDANIAPSTSTISYDVLNGSTAGSATVLTTTVPHYTSRAAGNTAAGLILNQYSSVASWYNGLVLTIRKPLGHSFELLANYTYSKALDDGETTGTNGTFYGTDDVTDPYNLNTDYSYSDLDQRHRFVGSITWTPNYFRGSSMVGRGVLNGWGLSTIFTAATGEPYTAELGGSTFMGVNGPDGGMTGAVVSTFASAAAGRATWLPRNSFNLPTFANIDLRVERDFSIHERFKLQVHADAFNLFNSQIVQAASTEAFTYTQATTTSTVCGTATHPGVVGCFVPFTSTPFGTPTTTSGALYGARQLQIGAQFVF
ncbi:MAG: TonB-dependent receptor [Candidatus Acidiferrales bacterium]